MNRYIQFLQHSHLSGAPQVYICVKQNYGEWKGKKLLRHTHDICDVNDWAILKYRSKGQRPIAKI